MVWIRPRSAQVLGVEAAQTLSVTLYHFTPELRAGLGTARSCRIQGQRGPGEGGVVHAKKWCASLHPLGEGGGLTFCQSMMRMMREMIVRTTKARMAEITTTLKGRAGGRQKPAISKQGAWQLSSPHPIFGTTNPSLPILPRREALLHQPWPVMSDSQPVPLGHTFSLSHKHPVPLSNHPQLRSLPAPTSL